MKYEKPTIVINKIEVKDDVAAGLQIQSYVYQASWSNLVRTTNVNEY